MLKEPRGQLAHKARMAQSRTKCKCSSNGWGAPRSSPPLSRGPPSAAGPDSKCLCRPGHHLAEPELALAAEV
eukprot:6411250-Alexandrium_andersonii.AAC.1